MLVHVMSVLLPAAQEGLRDAAVHSLQHCNIQI